MRWAGVEEMLAKNLSLACPKLVAPPKPYKPKEEAHEGKIGQGVQAWFTHHAPVWLRLGLYPSVQVTLGTLLRIATLPIMTPQEPPQVEWNSLQIHQVPEGLFCT